jgi:hypothetical protein
MDFDGGIGPPSAEKQMTRKQTTSTRTELQEAH